MVTQYKCPGCGNDLTFDAASGMLRCPSCGQTISIDEVPKEENPSADGSEPDISPFSTEDIEDEATYNYQGEKEAQQSFSGHEVHEYHCENCGAVIIVDADTTATSCSYCGAPVMLADRLTGNLAPARVIPFKITKEEATATFKKWCKHNLFTPSKFKNADRVKNITGMYIPFWLYDMNGRGDVDATCTKVRTYTRGEYDYTETSYFHVYRKFDLNYLKIPADASEKMADDLMDRLEPYHYNDLKKFEMPYLSGYLAEKYNYTDTDLYPRIKKRVDNYVTDYIYSSIQGYSSTKINRKDVHIEQHNAFYTLLPVWMVYYDYNDAEHVFAMNGQTGKVVGKPPIDKGKVLAWFGGMSGILFVILSILSLIIKMGGPQL